MMSSMLVSVSLNPFRGLLSSKLEGIAKDSHLFCLVTNEELKRVAESLEWEYFKAGEVLFWEDDRRDFIAIIGSGSVSVSKSTEFPGKNVILAKNGKDSFITLPFCPGRRAFCCYQRFCRTS